MSGRIWVVEWNMGSRTSPNWRPTLAIRNTRALARQAQAVGKRAGMTSRVVPYVRQGGAR